MIDLPPTSDRERLLESVNNFALEVVAHRSLPALQKVALARIRELCGADAAALYSLDPRTGVLACGPVDGPSDGLGRAAGQGLATRVAATAQPLLAAGIAASPDRAVGFEEVAGAGARSIIAAPLLVGGALVGVLEAARLEPQAPFTPLELELLTLLAPHLAAALGQLACAAELREENWRLQQGSALLEQRVRDQDHLVAVGQLASGVAHEINNPLGFIRSNLKALRETVGEVVLPVVHSVGLARAALEAGAVKQAQGLLVLESSDAAAELAESLEAVDEALAGTQRIEDIVRSLRELSRQEHGHLEPGSLNAPVAAAVTAVLGFGHAAHLSLEATVPVAVVAGQLQLAVEHVVRNARQACRCEQDIAVSTRDAAGSVVVEVSDRGCGIPGQHLAHVFEPFFTTRRVGAGRGLGLTATWGIVKRFGGDVTLESEVGAGTTVRLVLPPAHEGGGAATVMPAVGRYAELGRARPARSRELKTEALPEGVTHG